MNIIKDLRKERKMTMTALAKAAGISIPFLFDIEKGNRNPSQKTLERIANVLGVPIEVLCPAE